MELLVKCLVIALLTAISSSMLKRYLPEVSLAVVILASATLLGLMSGVLSEVLNFIETLARLAGISEEILTPVLKICAISVLSKITCDICKDAGASAMVTVVELGTAIMSVVLSIPLFNRVLGLITRM